MKKLLAIVSLTALTSLIVLGGMATTAAAPALLADMSTSVAASTTSPLAVTTTSASYFIPFGQVRLTCTSPTYYSVNAASTTAAVTTDHLAPGPIVVNKTPITRSVWLTVSSGTQWLALLLKSGVDSYCIAEQMSTDGQTGSFTTLAASSTLAVTGATTLSSTLGVTGATTLSSTAYIQGATTIDGALGSGGTISGAFDGGTARLGATSASSIDLPSSTQITGIKFGSITLGGQSPSTGTATVLASSKCTCTPETNAADGLTKCNLSSTTLTATGPNSSTGVINYICIK